MQQRNFIMFLAASCLLFIVYTEITRRIWGDPKPKPAAGGDSETNKGEPSSPRSAKADGLKGAAGVAGAWAAQLPKTERVKAPKPAAAPLPPTPEDKLVKLGQWDGEGPNPFHIEATFDPRGAGVRQLILNKFQAASSLGRPEWDEKDGVKSPKPFELLPAAENREISSFLLYHFDPTDPGDDHPLNTLGRVLWTPEVGSDGKPYRAFTGSDGRPQQQVAFKAELKELGVVVTKTYSLTAGEYNLGLEVRLQRLEDPAGPKDLKLRYQLTGGHGLPVEGKWYTSTFRNSQIGRTDKDNHLYKEFQDLREIMLKEGGDAVRKDPKEKLFIRYAGVAVEFFASAVVVDDAQKLQDFVAQVRATLETAVLKGKVKSVSDSGDSFVLEREEGGSMISAPRHEETEFAFDPDSPRARLLFDLGEIHVGSPIAVIYRSGTEVIEGNQLRRVAVEIKPEAPTQPLWESDVTVRLATEPIDLPPGADVVHKYLLYNGPVKARLLGQLRGDGKVAPEVVDHYLTGLRLDTLTDYHSPGFFGRMLSAIGWSSLIIWFTNLMHSLLEFLYWVVPNYGLCIILLTVLVRGLMFPLSRKQAQTQIRMQELAPELKKLQEKYKEDRQALATAQWDLYRRNKVQPLASCWVLLLQMPVFMGLYFCLQESIHFRLAEFWPTWIPNLAAPDMLYGWGENIPIISSPSNYANGLWSFLYLGPYLNLLPIFAAGLMLVVQKLTMPPPVDEQQAANAATMKYMTIVFGLMFYKVAAGLCLYFIASSVWGITERKLLPKKKPLVDSDAADRAALESPASGSNANTPMRTLSAPPTNGGGKRKAKKKRDGRPNSPMTSPSRPEIAPTPTGGLTGWWRARRKALGVWWQETLRQAEKRGR